MLSRIVYVSQKEFTQITGGEFHACGTCYFEGWTSCPECKDGCFIHLECNLEYETVEMVETKVRKITGR